MKTVLHILAGILFLPFLLVRDVFYSDRSIGKKIGYFFLVSLFFGLYWLVFYGALAGAFTVALYELGVVDTLTEVHVSGTSMLPTIEDGTTISLHNPNKFGLDRADSVSFINSQTGGIHYLKRIVGMPGERISIQNGSVIINGRALDEPYVLNSLPTFGNTFLLDCEEKTVPPDHFFVMGDNRTISSDSRFIGFVHRDDIDGVIKADQKPAFVSHTDTSRILDTEFDEGVFLAKLNEQRIGSGHLPLITHEALSALATERAGQVASNIDTWKQSRPPISDLLNERGYRHNLAHEYVTFGYLEADGVLAQILDSPHASDIFLSTEITEIGIGTAPLTNGSCNVPVIALIATWPSVPTYDQDLIDRWQSDIEALNTLLANMQTWVGVPGADQEAVQAIISKSAEAHVIAARIHSTMNAREWLGEEDYVDIQRYRVIVDEINALLDNGFTSVQGVSTVRHEWMW